MGAEWFTTEGEGADAAQAFKAAVDDAAYERGHGGYTGSIAEKRRFIMASDEVLAPRAAYALADSLIDDDRYADKWTSPAGCIELESKRPGVRMFLFFGLASS